MKRRTIALVVAALFAASACGPRGGATQATAGPTGPAGSPGAPTQAVELSGDLSVWTFPQGDDEKAIKTYGQEFEKLHPKVKVKVLTVAEGDPYAQKINTSLQAKNPPDIAIIEDRSWMQSGKVVKLDDHFRQWGIDLADFNPGGMARVSPTGKIEGGVYAIGDYLGGNILVYNKKLFDDAGVAHPPSDRSLTIQEYADICRKLGKPNADPNKTIYGCAMPFDAPSIQGKNVWGEEGRQILGNVNSPEMVEAYNVGSALIRDKFAPSTDVLDAATEAARFARGQLAITWSDFVETATYTESGVDFGIAPYFVVKEGDSFVDTYTAPWGTFTDSKNKAAALEFLRFLATEGQRLRMTISPDPPLSTKVAEEAEYGKDDPVKKAFLDVLQFAQPQPFVPPGVEAWDPAEVMRLMTVEGQTDAKPILDAQATKAQTELDQAWERWDKLGGG
jgi:ABC-type glycerol-3-phosphate transport system substrate-binding protein